MSELAGTFSLKLATFMRNGVGQLRSLQMLSKEAGEASETAGSVLERITQGVEPAHSIASEPGEAWNLLAAAWHVAEQSGAPIAGVLERMSTAFLRLDTLAKRRNVLLAGPKGTVLLIATLPVLAFVVGELLGAGAVEQIMTPIGALLMGAGVLFLIGGVAWGLAMIKSLTDQDELAGFELDLLWVALAGGSTPEEAKRIVVHSVDLFRVEWIDLGSFSNTGAATRMLQTSADSGAPIKDLVEQSSDREREHGLQTLEEGAEKLAIRILIPLGVCILPSFILIGVIPVMLGLLGT